MFKWKASKSGILAPVFEDNKKVTYGQQMTRNKIKKKWWESKKWLWENLKDNGRNKISHRDRKKKMDRILWKQI